VKVNAKTTPAVAVFANFVSLLFIVLSSYG
jgi:hypothetical protein